MMTKKEEFVPTHILDGVPVVKHFDDSGKNVRNLFRAENGTILPAMAASGPAVPIRPPAGPDDPPIIVRLTLSDMAIVLAAASNSAGYADAFDMSASRKSTPGPDGSVLVRFNSRPNHDREQVVYLKIPPTFILETIEV